MEKNLSQVKSDCIKVVLFGPESTGKTTLSRQLARHYNSVWVREFARQYLKINGIMRERLVSLLTYCQLLKDKLILKMN
jgi:nicotinamide riboside kinase